MFGFISVCTGSFSLSFSLSDHVHQFLFYLDEIASVFRFSPEGLSVEMNGNVISLSSSYFILSVLPHLVCSLYHPSIFLHVTHSSIRLLGPRQSLKRLMEWIDAFSTVSEIHFLNNGQYLPPGIDFRRILYLYKSILFSKHIKTHITLFICVKYVTVNLIWTILAVAYKISIS